MSQGEWEQLSKLVGATHEAGQLSHSSFLPAIMIESDTKQAVAQGLIAGFVGYLVIVLFFFVMNLLWGRSPFHTAAVMGGTFFYGLREVSEVAILPGPIIAYNGLHLVLSLIAGFGAAWLVFETERHHFLWYFVLFVFVAAFIYSTLLFGVLGAEVLGAFPWWSVIVANVLWVLGVGIYLWIAHRKLIGELGWEQRVPGPV